MYVNRSSNAVPCTYTSSIPLHWRNHDFPHVQVSQVCYSNVGFQCRKLVCIGRTLPRERESVQPSSFVSIRDVYSFPAEIPSCKHSIATQAFICCACCAPDTAPYFILTIYLLLFTYLLCTMPICHSSFVFHSVLWVWISIGIRRRLHRRTVQYHLD